MSVLDIFEYVSHDSTLSHIRAVVLYYKIYFLYLYVFQRDVLMTPDALAYKTEKKVQNEKKFTVFDSFHGIRHFSNLTLRAIRCFIILGKAAFTASYSIRVIE